MSDSKDESRGSNARASGERDSRDSAGGKGDKSESSREHESEADEPDRDERARAFRRFGDSLISNLLGDSSAAIRRGQGIVTGVAQGTKEELVRLISAEVRGFLDKMDAVDLVQEIVSGLVIEMKAEVRFRRAEDGKIEPQVEAGETKLRRDDEKPSRSEKPGRSKPERETED